MEIKHKLLPKQKAFIQSSAREVLYSGAFGAGKTRALCFKLLSRAIKPGAREFLCRKTNVSLKKSTLHTLLKADGDLPPVLPLGSYQHYKADQIITIHGGGEILYSGLDDPEKIGSIQLTGAAVDEAVELNEADWTMLRGRIRVNLKGLNNQIYAACNPGSPSHFLAERFGLVRGKHPQPNCMAITTQTNENRFLNEEYVADLETLTGVAYDRFVRGLWVGSDGLIYDKWDRDIHVSSSKNKSWKYTVLAIDDGYSNPFVIIRLRVDGDGRAYIDKELYQSKLINSEKVRLVKDMMSGCDVESVVIDPSAAELIEEMVRNNIPARAANNEVFGGIVRVQGRLVVQGDNRPRLTVSPECENVIREFESYEWKNSKVGIKDEPIKQNDHAMDAIRYGVNYIDEFGGMSYAAIRI